MDSYVYEEVNTEDGEIITKEKESVKSVIKQILICSVVWTQFFMAGLSVGAPTVFTPQLRKEGIPVDAEMASWFYSATILGVFPWAIVMPLFTKRYGRKIPELMSAILIGISFILLYFSNNFYHIYISEVLQGCLHSANVTVTILVVMEYCSPNYRGLFLTIKSASYFWGIWIANVIGTYFHWKHIALLGIICTVYTFTVFLWPESPFWLASRNRIDECRNAFRCIHGINKTSEKELHELITAQNELKSEGVAVNKIEMFKAKEFYKPLILSLVAITQYHFSGKIVSTLYVLDIFKYIMSDERSAYNAMIILDGVTVTGMYFGAILSKILKRRTLYLSSSFTGVFFMLLISLYLFLVRMSYLVENKYLTLSLFTAYSLAMCCGPMILSLSIYGEIVPIKYQASSYLIVTMTFGIIYVILVKFAPSVFAKFGIDGTFLFYGVVCGLCTIYLYLYLPETRNKTQREIAMFFRGENKKDNCESTEDKDATKD